MKKITLTAISRFLPLLWAGAVCAAEPSAGRISDGERIVNKAMLQTNYRNTLWLSTDNAAGLAFSPLAAYNDLNLSYSGKFGEFSVAQDAVTSHNIQLATSGALSLGGFSLWGDFSFTNIFDKGVRYNSIRYEVPENMPYYIADSYPSDWNRQEYDLSVKGASPVLWDLMSFGLSIDYLTRVGAKQLDPRCETYNYHINAAPSVAFCFASDHHLGLDGFFEYGYERSVPSLNNQFEDQKVFITSGLGEYLLGKVGGNDGQKTWIYRALEYGGGLQYSWSRDIELLFNADFHIRQENAFANPKLIKRMGSSKDMRVSGDFTILFGKEFSDRIRLEGLYSSADGIEYVQQLNTEAFNQRWEVLAENVMSSFNRMEATLSYDHLFGVSKERGYDWKVGAEAGFVARDYSYLIPVSTFTASSLSASVCGAWHGKFRKASLLLALDAGYSKSLGGEFLYGGTKGDSDLQNLYRWDIAVLSSDFLKTGAEATCTINRRKVNYRLSLSGTWFLPFGKDYDKTLCNFTFGIIF